MKHSRAKHAVNAAKSRANAGEPLFWITVSLVILVPLVFSASLHRTYITPKLAILLIGSAGIAPLTALAFLDAARKGYDLKRLFNPTHLLLVSLYFASVAVSTAFGLDPLASLFGFFHNQMGLVPRLCFFVCFAGLIFGINNDETRLDKVLWAMLAAGFLASAYAVVQFFGYDPFLQSSLYTYQSEEVQIRRVIGTLGHANYLGNFLMYTTPVSAALAVATGGRARPVALVATVTSVAAVSVSGTRGAWVGILAAALTVCFLEFRSGKRTLRQMNRRVMIRWAALALAIILVAAVAIGLSPAGRSVAVRARSLVTEGFTGSGRTLLWRDSIKMIPAFAFAGSGPDSFRLAFLPYKSEEMSRVTGFNNESSHNSYLDAAISYGLPGALLYIAVIASAFRLAVAARRRAASPRLKIIITGLIASLVAVAVHNFFIFDQISTGLYFFVLVGLAQVVSNLAAGAQTKEVSKISNRAEPTGQSFKSARWAVIAAGCALVAAALWYSVGVLRADHEINQALASADKGELDRVIEQGERAAGSPEPTGDYDLMLARALALCSTRLDAAFNTAVRSGGDSQRVNEALDLATELAVTHAQKSLAHTFTPELSHLLLASFARSRGDAAKMRESATEAVRLDPNNFHARLMLAEANMASGSREQAAREAEAALSLRPGSAEAKSVLAQARGKKEPRERKVKRLLERAQKSTTNGKLKKARRLTHRSLRLAKGVCADCHRLLAMIHEAGGQNSEAIAEWQLYMSQAPERAAAEKVAERIEALKQKR
jgi:O-antigen ligase/Tfp pilus assembly protein PilF